MQKCKVNIEAPTQSSQNGDLEFTGKDMEKQELLCYIGMDLN